MYSFSTKYTDKDLCLMARVVLGEQSTGNPYSIERVRRFIDRVAAQTSTSDQVVIEKLEILANLHY